MALFSLPQLRERGATQLRVESYLGATRTASSKLANESAAYDAEKTYDVFLSHSALDAEVIYGIKLEIERYGFPLTSIGLKIRKLEKRSTPRPRQGLKFG